MAGPTALRSRSISNASQKNGSNDANTIIGCACQQCKRCAAGCAARFLWHAKCVGRSRRPARKSCRTRGGAQSSYDFVFRCLGGKSLLSTHGRNAIGTGQESSSAKIRWFLGTPSHPFCSVEGAAPAEAGRPRNSSPLAAAAVIGTGRSMRMPRCTPGPIASIHTRRHPSSAPVPV